MCAYQPDMHRAALVFGLGLFAASGAAPDSDAPILIAAGRWNQARAMIEPRVKANSADAEAAAMLSQVRLVFGDLDGAIEMAETAIKLNGKVAEYHWLLARACGEKARVSGILKALGLAKRFRQEAEEAIALDPGHIQSRLYLISYYAGAPGIAGGDRKKAEQLVDEVAGLSRTLASGPDAREAGPTDGSNLRAGVGGSAETRLRKRQ